MADEQSTTPPVSDLAAQLAAHIANKPLGPAAGSVPTTDSGRPPREARPPREDRGPREQRGPRPEGQPNREARPPREGGNRPPQGQGGRPGGGEHRGERPAGGERREGRPGGERGDRPQGDRDRGPRPGGDRGRFDFPQDIDLDKLINDSLYLDNQAHAVVVRIRDMDSGTRSTLRRLYNSVRRATRAADTERQHEFVMLRARLAYTIARHGLRSLDQIERLLLQVTRKNEARGYERFRDLFEAIVAYNE